MRTSVGYYITHEWGEQGFTAVVYEDNPVESGCIIFAVGVSGDQALAILHRDHPWTVNLPVC